MPTYVAAPGSKSSVAGPKWLGDMGGRVVTSPPLIPSIHTPSSAYSSIPSCSGRNAARYCSRYATWAYRGDNLGLPPLVTSGAETDGDEPE